MPPFTLHIASEADAADIQALLQTCYPPLMAEAYPPEILLAALPLMTLANPTLLASGRYHLARDATGRLLGAGGWSPEDPASKEVVPELGHIRHFAVLPEATGQGIGRALFDQCLRQSQQAGITAFNCYSSLNAEGFYAALGFADQGPVSVPMGKAGFFPALLMHRRHASGGD